MAYPKLFIWMTPTVMVWRLYWDRPREEWPKDEHGDLTMFTKHLDLHGLLALTRS